LHQDFQEMYLLKIVEGSGIGRKPLIELKFFQIDNILMKNIPQKQFLI